MKHDPNKFIGCESECRLFEELLEFKDGLRVLGVRDISGTGKSHLLEKIQHRCRTAKPKRIPVSLIDFAEFTDASPFALIIQVAGNLSGSGVNLERFKAYNNARVSGDFLFIRSFVNFQDANLQDASNFRISGTNIERAETVNTVSRVEELSPEQQSIAKDACIRFFFQDLREYCAANAVVVILDSYEKCPDSVTGWIEDDLLAALFFNFAMPPVRLLLIVAGRETPQFELRWPPDDCDTLIKPVNGLSKWERKHIEEFLSDRGFVYDIEHLDLFCKMIEFGMPTSFVIQGISHILSQRSARNRNITQSP